MGKFKLRVNESEKITERSETLTAEIMGYGVWVDTDKHLTRMSISPVNWGNPMRVGIVQLHPKTVAELEHFADIAGDLFRAIAEGLREAGKDDLRSPHEREMDEWKEQFEKIGGHEVTEK